MPEETGLGTAIPQTAWQDTKRETDPRDRRRRAERKKETLEQPPSKPRKPKPPEGTGTRLDVTV